MKLTRNDPAPTFTLELTEREAQTFRAIVMLDYTIPSTLKIRYLDADAAERFLEDAQTALDNAGVVAK